MPKVFVSHSSKDREYVEAKIIPTLRAHSIDMWYSKEDIPHGVRWESYIKQGLKECDWFIVIMGPNAAASEWVKDEVHWAVNNRRGRVIPVLIADVDPFEIHIRLPSINYIDCRSNCEEGAKRLVSRFSGAVQEQDFEPPQVQPGTYEEEVLSSPHFPRFLATFAASSESDRYALAKSIAMGYEELKRSNRDLLGGAQNIDQFLEVVDKRCQPKLFEAIQFSYDSARAILRYSGLILKHPLFSAVRKILELPTDKEVDSILAIALSVAYNLVQRMTDFEAVDSVERFLRICANQRDCRHKRLMELVQETGKLTQGFRNFQERTPGHEVQVFNSPRFPKLSTLFQASSQDDRFALAKAIALAYWAFEKTEQEYLRGANSIDQFLEVLDERCDAKLREAIVVAYGTVRAINHYSAQFVTHTLFTDLTKRLVDKDKHILADAMAVAYRGVRQFLEFQSIDSLQYFFEALTNSADCRHDRLKQVVKELYPIARNARSYFSPAG